MHHHISFKLKLWAGRGGDGNGAEWVANVHESVGACGGLKTHGAGVLAVVNLGPLREQSGP